MGEHAQLVFAIGFASLIACGAAAFLGWVLWSLFWDVYDHLMEQRTRRRHNRFDGARSTTRFAFRDMKGVTK